MTASYTPIIVGVAQFTQAKDTPVPKDPVGLMAESAQSALDDTGLTNLGDHVDTLRVVNVFSHSYKDACGILTSRMGISPETRYYSSVGGNTPQLYVNKAAMDIAAGRSRVTLITGAEAGFAARRALKGEVTLDWPPHELPEKMDGDNRDGGTSYEYTYDIAAPAYTYAFFENALRHAAGRDMETHRRIIGDICEKLTKVAATHPQAWFKQVRTSDEITLPEPPNRFVGFPYTLWMSANLNVDQSAAVVMTSEETASELGIPKDKWIYPMGGATFHNVWNVVRRPELHTSPALKQAGTLALEQAGLSITDIDVFDLYNCFPVAVELAQNELGIPIDDPRPISLTGGLAYFGGPGNNYSLHSIANMVERLRERDVAHGLVTALGWFNTKWSVGVYGLSKGKNPWIERDDSAIQAGIDETALPEPEEKPDGLLTIESYTLVYRQGDAPDHMTVIGRMENGRRAFAAMYGDPDTLKQYTTTCPIGNQVKVKHDDGSGLNLITP